MLFVSSIRNVDDLDSLFSVSISESRCFSFQVTANDITVTGGTRGFQSRNRDAFRFKCGLIRIVGDAFKSVSISESRCFSFQAENTLKALRDFIIVSISESRCFSFQVYTAYETRKNETMFQSRNRDAFRFKPAPSEVLLYLL